MTLTDALREYGWAGFLILWFLDKAFPRFWPFFTDKVFPAKAKEREQEADARRKSEEKLLNARLEQERREQEHRRDMEERTTKAIEAVTNVIAINNERMGTLIAALGNLQNFTISAVNDMRLTTQQFHSIQPPKSPRKKGK